MVFLFDKETRMRLENLSIINFKNIAEERLELSEGINCFVGHNGAGKTNILDAIHYLSSARSMHTITDTQSVRHDEDFFLIDGGFRRDDGRPEQVVCSYARRSGKTLKRNGKEYDKLSDHVGCLPIVVVSPADSSLISDSAEERRRYFNRLLSHLDRSYLAALMRYNTALVGVEINYSTYPERKLEEWHYPKLYIREKTDDAGRELQSRKLGWNTTAVTRPRILANLHAVMRDSPEAVRSAATLREMLVFVRNKHMRPEAAPGEHDDLVIAAAISHGIRDQQSVEITQEKPKPRKKLKEQLEKNNRRRRR